MTFASAEADAPGDADCDGAAGEAADDVDASALGDGASVLETMAVDGAGDGEAADPQPASVATNTMLAEITIHFIATAPWRPGDAG